MFTRYQQNRLPRTGQVTSYRTGDDADRAAGAKVCATRASEYVALGDGTIYDRATGLYWPADPIKIIPGATGVQAANQVQTARSDWANSTAYALADLVHDPSGGLYWVCCVAHTSASSGTFGVDFAAHPTYWRQTIWTGSAANLTTAAGMTWAAAIDACVGLTYAGRSDWRLPTYLEILSIINFESTDAPPDCALTNMRYDASYGYWLSSTYTGLTTYAYALTTGVNFPSFARYLKTAATYFAYPCAGGR